MLQQFLIAEYQGESIEDRGALAAAFLAQSLRGEQLVVRGTTTPEPLIDLVEHLELKEDEPSPEVGSGIEAPLSLLALRWAEPQGSP
jgi:hypothetical protein